MKKEKTLNKIKKILKNQNQNAYTFFDYYTPEKPESLKK